MMEKISTSIKKEICNLHGEYDSVVVVYNELGITHTTKCRVCNDILTKQKEAEQNKLREQKERTAIIRAVLNRAAIPPAFTECTFDNYEIYLGGNQQQIFNNLRYFAENFENAKSKNIHGILTGSTGTGKTHLSIAIINELIKKGYTAVFATMSEITDLIKSSFNEKNISTKSIIDRFAAIDFLVIDETAISDKNFDKDEIFKIINLRYSLKHPTLVITNVIDELKNKLGHRSMSRLQQGKFVQVFNWEDYRTRNVKAK